MKIVLKKEFKSFMTSMTGYVFIAFMLAITGIYYTAYHLQSGYPVFSYTLSAVMFIFLIAVPVLTMRVIAEERKQKTDQLLLTSPISVTDIIAGKYFALLSVWAIVTGILCIYPLILLQFGTVSLSESYTALFGFFLVGSSYMAIGLFLSSLTESPVIAAVLTFLILFVCYVIEGIAGFFPETAAASFFTIIVIALIATYVIWHILKKLIPAIAFAVISEGIIIVTYILKPASYEGLIQNFFNIFNITDHFSEFADGMFDVQGIIYYLSVILIFLYLSVQAVESRRWGNNRLRNGSYSISMTAIVVAACIAANLIVTELPSAYTEIDMTSQQLSVLGDQTKEMAAALSKDVTIYYILQDSNRDTNVSRLLDRYENLSSHIDVVEKDPVRYPNFVSQYTSETLSENSCIVVCGENSRVVNYNDMYESSFDYNYYSYMTTGFDAEGQLTSAIAAVSSDDLPILYTLTGHGESELDSTMTGSVEKQNISIESLNLVSAEKVPGDCSCLLINSPTTDISEAEKNRILSYMKTGGSVLIITDYTGTDMPQLSELLEAYGLEITEGVVIEGSSQYYTQVPYYLIPEIESTEVSSDMTGGSAYVLMVAAQGISVSEDASENLEISQVLTTSDASYSKTDVENMQTYSKEDGDIDGPFAIGMLVSESVELTDELLAQAEALNAGTTETDALSSAISLETDETADSSEKAAEDEPEEAVTEEVISEAETGTEETSAEDETEEEESVETAESKLALYTSSMLVNSNADAMVSGGNSKLFLNTLSWMCGNEVNISIPVKSLSYDYLVLTTAGSSFWSIIVIGIIPGSILIFGLYIWLKRRKL